MKWEEARDKLLKVAAGRHCLLQFEMTFEGDKPIMTGCWLYVEGGFSSEIQTTWEKAFESLERRMKTKPQVVEEEPVGVDDKVEKNG